MIQIKRALLLLLCMGIALSGWFFSSAKSVASAVDETPAPTDEIEDPIFPPVTPEPESDVPTPLYDVPLALNPHDHFYFIQPITLDAEHGLLPDFRYGYEYTDEDAIHTGVDITSPLHQPVLAAGDGQVIFAGYGLLNGGGDKNDPYGLAILIKHNFSYNNQTIYTVYAHLDRIDVQKNQMVQAGEQIGIVGMTGNTSGPHLHFEVRTEDEYGGRVQNPELWMAPSLGSGVLAGKLKSTYGYLLSTQTLYLKSLETDQIYEFISYKTGTAVFPDPYFDENFVFGNIPAGTYQLSTIYNYRWYRLTLTIAPGTVNTVCFNGKDGFSQECATEVNPDSFLNH